MVPRHGLQTFYIIYIMRNGVWQAKAALAVDQVFPPFPGTQQRRDRSMTTMDPHDRIDMTGPWAGFGFQRGHMFTLEGHSLEPSDLTTSEFAENGGWAWVNPVPAPSRQMRRFPWGAAPTPRAANVVVQLMNQPKPLAAAEAPSKRRQLRQ